MREHLVDSRSPDQPRGVLIDRGTNKRIPLAIWFDPETGEYEAYKAAPNGHDILVGNDERPVKYKGKSKGKLELLATGQARLLGHAAMPPRKVKEVIEPAIDEEAGLEIYKKCYIEVWSWRGMPRRSIDDRWSDYLSKTDFLDSFILKRRIVPTR